MLRLAFAAFDGILGAVKLLLFFGLVFYALGAYQYYNAEPGSFFYDVEAGKGREEVIFGDAAPKTGVEALDTSLIAGSYACLDASNQPLIRKIYDDGFMIDYRLDRTRHELNLYQLSHVTEKSMVQRMVGWVSGDRNKSFSIYDWHINKDKKSWGTGDVIDIFVRPEMMAFSRNADYAGGVSEKDPQKEAERKKAVSKNSSITCEPAGIDTTPMDAWKNDGVSKFNR